MSDIVSVHAIEAITKGEIDVQIATAKRYPRELLACIDEAKDMATHDTDTAESCMYALPRGDKKLEGGSIRLAEIIVSVWGNMQTATRIIEIGENHVTAQGVCFDLQKNVNHRAEVRRKITDRNGRRYSEDMITVTCNAAAAIALRNAIFKVVPRAHWQKIYNAARDVAIGDTTTLQERRSKMLSFFSRVGVFEERILQSLGLQSVEEIGLEDLAKLVGTATQIREGNASVDELFPGQAAKKSTLKDRAGVKAKKSGKAENSEDHKKRQGIKGNKEEKQKETSQEKEKDEATEAVSGPSEAGMMDEDQVELEASVVKTALMSLKPVLAGPIKEEYGIVVLSDVEKIQGDQKRLRNLYAAIQSAK